MVGNVLGLKPQSKCKQKGSLTSKNENTRFEPAIFQIDWHLVWKYLPVLHMSYFVIYLCLASPLSVLHPASCASALFQFDFLHFPEYLLKRTWTCCFTNWLNVFNPHRLFGSWSTFVTTGLPPFSKMDPINFSLTGPCCSFAAFNCNYAPFPVQPQIVNLLLAVQEFMNRCIYFVVQKLLHFYPFCLSCSCSCTSTLAFTGYVLSCASV